jgi:hypothetical protein
VLYVLGMGFDPRMCLGLEALVQEAGLTNFDVWLLEFDEGEDSPSQRHKREVQENRTKLSAILPEGQSPIVKRVETLSSDGKRRVRPRNAAKIFQKGEDFADYTDVIVDISALPRGLYFPAIAALLYLCDDTKAAVRINLHVFAWDDTDLDKSIRDVGIEDRAEYLFPFAGDDKEAEAHVPTIWIPLLGEGQKDQLSLIDEFFSNTKEIVPILPFPSRVPRRADDLFLEYRELLLEKLLVEPANFCYASEQNPFAVYRQIMRIVKRYRLSLKPLGGVRFVFSALSSKLFSLGALLAAHEMRNQNVPVGIAHVECHGYELDEGSAVHGELFGLWLCGELYGE